MTRERPDPRQHDERPSDQPGGVPPGGTREPMAPGDEAPAGTPGTGENICRRCGGGGTVDGGTCPECDGRGTVVEGIGGA